MSELISPVKHRIQVNIVCKYKQIDSKGKHTNFTYHEVIPLNLSIKRISFQVIYLKFGKF